MNRIIIDINPIWLKEKTDLSKCCGCNDIIYGNLFRLWIMPKKDNVNLTGHKTDMVLCESCIDLIS